MKTEKTLITGHSGADGTPDNSMEFVRYVLGTQADVLEIDVRRGHNGNLIICHEEATRECVNLREIFMKVKNSPSIRVNCDLKEAGLEELVWNLAGECELEPERLIYSGTVWPGGSRKAHPWRQVEIQWNVEECIPDVYTRLGSMGLTSEMILKLVDSCKVFDVSVININEKYLSEELIESMRKNEIGISAWTVNDPDRIRTFLRERLYNITTRNLMAALALREEKEYL